MSLTLKMGGEEIDVTFSTFPAGESFVKINKLHTPATLSGLQHAMITMNFEGNDDIINLALLTDAVRRNYYVKGIALDLVYLPYARQDRVMSHGESLSVRVIADIINSLNFEHVLVTDCHSAVGLACLNNVVERDLIEATNGLSDEFWPETTVLVSPDAGANKKVLALARSWGFPNVVRADKTRDVLTGKITGTVVHSEHVGEKDFLIVDDICDGGRTFIELAKELRKLTTGKIYLYVTHGIFSAGVKVFDGLIDKVYISNPVGNSGKMAALQDSVVVI
jgi:ribose-phosphate pyrophosphokinase